MDMLDSKDPLIVLADNFPWSKVESKFQKYYKNDKVGRPNKPIRLMVGLLLLKQSWIHTIKEIKELRIQLRFFKHPKKLKKALGAMKRLRDIDRKFGENLNLHKKYAQSFYLFNRVLKQERNTPNKIYSLHEIDAYAINKGKDHKGYEFGTKASIVTTKTTNIIVGVSAHKTNIHDSKTLAMVLCNAASNVGNQTIKEAICDRGYRGIKKS
jgi:IS5 family transposase